MTGIREADWLELVHILLRSRYLDLAEHPENVLALNSLYHRAFDAALFTIDSNYRIRTSPSFDSVHPFPRETIFERVGEQLTFLTNVEIRPSFLDELNAACRGCDSSF